MWIGEGPQTATSLRNVRIWSVTRKKSVLNQMTVSDVTIESKIFIILKNTRANSAQPTPTIWISAIMVVFVLSHTPSKNSRWLNLRKWQRTRISTCFILRQFGVPWVRTKIINAISVSTLTTGRIIDVHQANTSINQHNALLGNKKRKPRLTRTAANSSTDATRAMAGKS